MNKKKKTIGPNVCISLEKGQRYSVQNVCIPVYTMLYDLKSIKDMEEHKYNINLLERR